MGDKPDSHLDTIKDDICEVGCISEPRLHKLHDGSLFGALSQRLRMLVER